MSELAGVPSHLNVDRIKEALMKIEDVYSVEDLNIWSLTSGKSTAIVHMQLSTLGRAPGSRRDLDSSSAGRVSEEVVGQGREQDNGLFFISLPTSITACCLSSGGRREVSFLGLCAFYFNSFTDQVF